MAEANFIGVKIAFGRKTNLWIDQEIPLCLDWIQSICQKGWKSKGCNFTEFMSSWHKTAETGGKLAVQCLIHNSNAMKVSVSDSGIVLVETDSIKLNQFRKEIQNLGVNDKIITGAKREDLGLRRMTECSYEDWQLTSIKTHKVRLDGEDYFSLDGYHSPICAKIIYCSVFDCSTKTELP